MIIPKYLKYDYFDPNIILPFAYETKGSKELIRSTLKKGDEDKFLSPVSPRKDNPKTRLIAEEDHMKVWGKRGKKKMARENKFIKLSQRVDIPEHNFTKSKNPALLTANVKRNFQVSHPLSRLYKNVYLRNWDMVLRHYGECRDRFTSPVVVLWISLQKWKHTLTNAVPIKAVPTMELASKYFYDDDENTLSTIFEESGRYRIAEYQGIVFARYTFDEEQLRWNKDLHTDPLASSCDIWQLLLLTGAYTSILSNLVGFNKVKIDRFAAITKDYKYDHNQSSVSADTEPADSDDAD